MARGPAGRARVAPQPSTPLGHVDDIDEPHLSPKARRTRARLVDAASDVFCELQYLDTNVALIVERAGVSHGTFYTYFDSKEDIFREVGLELQRRILAARDSTPHHDGASILERVEAANRSFLAAYQQNARLFAVIEQVATFNEELRAIRVEIRDAFVARSEQAIARFQEEGLVHDDVDPRYAANALGSMVDRFAYVWLVLGEDFDFDESVRTLTLLWARALGVDVPPGALAPPPAPKTSRKRATKKAPGRR